MSDVDAKILGKIILLQSTIHLMQENEPMARFVCRGLSAVPGIDSLAILINGAFHSDIGGTADAGACRDLFDSLSEPAPDRKPEALIAAFKDHHGLECLKIRTAFDLYGILFLKLNDGHRFLGYRPYIENTLNLIALIVENNHRRALLLKNKEDLERAVEERTRELKASQEKYKTLFESIRDVIVVADLDRNIISVNQAFTEVFGYGMAEILGRRTQVLYAEEAQFHRLGERLEKEAEARQFFITLEYQKKSGERFPGETHIFDLRDVGGETVGFMGIIRDISERVRAEEENRRLEAQLFQARKMEAIGTLSGGVAHDFNNILSIVIGNAEMAQEEIPEWHPAHGLLEEVMKASLRARDVIRQLLTFSRKSHEKKKPIDLSPIVKEAVKLIRATLPSSIEIRWNIPDRLPAVAADATQIHQIMLNLCGNAADAMAEEGGVLEVGLDAIPLDGAAAAFDPDLSPGPFIRLTVSDTGPGVGPEEADRIFEPYYTTKDVGKGSGMGLAVVHGIVKRHRGGIRVRRRNGRGAAFDIFLPSIPEAAATSEAPITGELPTGAERILFVDDEVGVAELNRRRLEKLGYRVASKTDPVEALSVFQSDPDGFDLVITDMTMPKMTGDRLIKELLKIRPELPVVLCTGFSTRISPESAAALGIRRYLEKPIEIRDLAVLIREILDRA